MNEKQKAWQTYKIVMVMITFLLFVVGLMWGMVNYDYEIDKCSKLNTQASNYDFEHTVELDANFNQHCFYYKNHPLAFIWSVIGFGLLGALISIFGWGFWAMYLDNKDWDGSDGYGSQYY